MALKFLKYRWQKIILIIFLGLLSLVLVLALVVNRYWSPILENKLKDFVTKSSDSLYRVDFSNRLGL